VTGIAADFLAGLEEMRAFPQVSVEDAERAFAAPLAEDGLRDAALDALYDVLA
jgi:hypothetical protein